MLYVKNDATLGAKLADLGTAVQLSSNNDTVKEPMGTSGYAGIIICYLLDFYIDFIYSTSMILYKFILYSQ